MGKCAACGSVILFGGVRDGDRVYCNGHCRGRAGAVVTVPDDVVEEQARKLHQGPCPRCGGPGPVDVHRAHTVWSAVVLTSWKSQPYVCCTSCGNKARWQALAFSMGLGWWGVPFGLVLTPVQVGRNIAGLVSSHDPLQPSSELLEVVRSILAARGVVLSPPPGGQPSFFETPPPGR